MSQRREPSNLAKNLSKSFAKHYAEFTDQKVVIEELSRRLADLEEKERARSREEHDRELSFDEQAIRDGRFYDDRLDER